MILADKIIRLRKKNGWSQEELADRMQVSRQAVSKWEGAQTVPDLERILMLGELFGVTTDYLLKDSMEDEEFTDTASEPQGRTVTLPQAHEYLTLRRRASWRIAAATLLCVAAVIPLLILGAASETALWGMTEELACEVGLAALLATVAVAVVLFVRVGFESAPYEFLDKEPFTTEYGVRGLARETQEKYHGTYRRCHYIGTCLCVLSPLPLLMTIGTQREFLSVVMLTVTILLAGVGAAFFIVAGVRRASTQRLLKEGEFAPARQRKSRIKETVGSVYWLIATAVYLGWSFATEDWGHSWMVWPIAGVLFAAVVEVCALLADHGRHKGGGEEHE